MEALTDAVLFGLGVVVFIITFIAGLFIAVVSFVAAIALVAGTWEWWEKRKKKVNP